MCFVVICKYYHVSYKKNPKNVVPPLGLINNTAIEEEELNERGYKEFSCTWSYHLHTVENESGLFLRVCVKTVRNAQWGVKL
jgi:hypothetical protein